MNDCRFGVSPVNYPDPDPDPDPTQRRAIKEACKVVNRDWVNHQACSLSHRITFMLYPILL